MVEEFLCEREENLSMCVCVLDSIGSAASMSYALLDDSPAFGFGFWSSFLSGYFFLSSLVKLDGIKMIKFSRPIRLHSLLQKFCTGSWSSDSDYQNYRMRKDPGKPVGKKGLFLAIKLSVEEVVMRLLMYCITRVRGRERQTDIKAFIPYAQKDSVL